MTPIPLEEDQPDYRTIRPNWQLWLGILISLICLYLAFRGVPFSQLVDELRKVNPSWLLVSLAISLATLVAKAARWRVLFAPPNIPALPRLFSIQTIGMLFNLFMPARLGDLVRAYLMGEAQAIHKIYVLGTILIEKLSDLAILLFSVLLLVSLYALPGWLLQPSETAAILLLFLFLLLVVLASHPAWFMGAVERLGAFMSPFWQGWLRRQVSRGLDSLDVLRSPGQLLRVAFWTILIWGLGFMTNYVLFLSVGLPLPVWAAIFLLAVLQVGIAVPSSPGRIGVFHYLTVLALQFFNVERPIALGYSLVLYIVAILPPTLLGVWFLWREKITWNKLYYSARRIRGNE